MDEPHYGVDLMSCVLYDAQQTYFVWLGKTANCLDLAAVNRIDTPTFSALEEAVLSLRVDGLSALPLSGEAAYLRPQWHATLDKRPALAPAMKTLTYSTESTNT